MTLLKQLEALLVPECKEKLDAMTSLLEIEVEYKAKKKEKEKEEEDDTLTEKEENEEDDTTLTSTDLSIFPSFNRLCSIFPSVRFPLDHTKKVYVRN